MIQIRSLSVALLVLLEGCTSGNQIPKEDTGIKWLATTAEVIATLKAKDQDIHRSYSNPNEVAFVKRFPADLFLGEAKVKQVAYDFAGLDEKNAQKLTWIEYEFSDGLKKPTTIFAGAATDFGKPEFDIHRYSGLQLKGILTGSLSRPGTYNGRVAVWRIKSTTIKLQWEEELNPEYRLEMYYDEGAKLTELKEERKNFMDKGYAREVER